MTVILKFSILNFQFSIYKLKGSNHYDRLSLERY